MGIKKRIPKPILPFDEYLRQYGVTSRIVDPNYQDEQKLKQWLGSTRFLFNAGLATRKENYEVMRRNVGFNDLARDLVELKQMEEFEWLNDVPAQSLQQALMNLDRAYANFFKGLSDFPTFKKRHQHGSIRFPDPKAFKVKKLNRKYSSILLPKGLILKFRSTKKITGTIKSATISFDGLHYNISFLCEEICKKKTGLKSQIGIDMGITETAHTSNGEAFSMPKKAKEISKRVSALQKRLKHKVNGSNNKARLRLKIAKNQRKITNIRKDFLHKTSTNLAKNHGLIVLEDLKIKNMSKSASGTIENPGRMVKQKSGLNREILFQGWGMFSVMLEYKTKWAGGETVFVNPRNTSRTCTSCGFVAAENRSRKRFCCVSCGFQDDADHVGAVNILRKFTAGQAGCDCGGANIGSAGDAVTSSSRTRKSA